MITGNDGFCPFVAQPADFSYEKWHLLTIRLTNRAFCCCHFLHFAETLYGQGFEVH
jgi:hypothetical protein